MRFKHKGCGGEVDTKARKCLKCNKKWGRSSFLFATDLRPMVGVDGQLKTKERPVSEKPLVGQTSYAKWGDKVPGVSQIASHLPNWPRWVRILVFVVVWGGSLTAIILWAIGII